MTDNTVQLVSGAQEATRSVYDAFQEMTAIELNHTIVPAHDEVASATFFARIFGLP
jgi:hypothetical protein